MEGIDSDGPAIMPRPDPKRTVVGGRFEGGRVASRTSGCETLNRQGYDAYSDLETKRSK